MSLFCEIDNYYIKTLASRCEKFINNIQSEEGNEDIESNDDIESNLAEAAEEDEYNSLAGGVKSKKKPKGRTAMDTRFFLKFLLALLITMSYFLWNYLSELEAVTVTLNLG